MFVKKKMTRIHFTILEKWFFENPIQNNEPLTTTILHFCFMDEREGANSDLQRVGQCGSTLHILKDGDESIYDKVRSRRPCEAVTSEKIAKVDDLVTNDLVKKKEPLLKVYIFMAKNSQRVWHPQYLLH